MKHFVYCRKSSEAEDRQVLSLESQQTTVERTFEGQGLEVVSTFTESRTARKPGRPVFNEMLDRIDSGEADAIMAWSPDRLSRNSLDAGRIIYMLDIGAIKDLKFVTYKFENTPEGKFMLAIMLGQSKYSSDKLSVDVRRGNLTKLEHGWRPNSAPLGYVNDRETRTILPDDNVFPVIRKMYDLMLTGSYSPRQIAKIARDDWGFRTPQRKRSGGTPLAMSAMYKILSNPFYAGTIVWKGKVFQGKHTPLCTLDEQRLIKAILTGRRTPRPQHLSFPYVGLIACKTCGLSITAERKTNRYGSQYVYYHCTNSRMEARCAEPYIEGKSLDAQVRELISDIQLPAKIAEAIQRGLSRRADRLQDQHDAKVARLDSISADLLKQISELTTLRIRGLIPDAEFVDRQKCLRIEHLNLVQKREALGKASKSIELFEAFISFRKCAVDWFDRADDHTKRLILKMSASNFFLKDKKLLFCARKPFVTRPDSDRVSTVRAVVETVRTFFEDDSDEVRAVVESLFKLRDQFAPTAPKSPRPHIENHQPYRDSLHP